MFHFDWAGLFQSIPHWLATMLISMIPIAELRAAIPIGITSFSMPWWQAYIWAVLGNLIPVVFILWLLEPVSRWLMQRYSMWRKFFDWLFARTRRKFTSGAAKYGLFAALVIFVAIPLPMTGAWTGSIAAFLFGIPFRQGFLAIALGVLIAGVVVTLATVGITSIVQ